MRGKIDMYASLASLNLPLNGLKLNRRAFLLAGTSALSLGALVAGTSFMRSTDGWLLMESDV